MENDSSLELTRRELTILRNVGLGYPNHEIGKNVHISTHTVKVHISSIIRKLNAKNRANAVYIGLKYHLID